MAGRIEDYALIGDFQTVALVGRDGSIDWLCMPRFDSPACFAALLGDDGNGHWRIAPSGAGAATSRRYVGYSLVLESTWETGSGAVKVIDFMPRRDEAPDIVRIVEGVSGRVEMHAELRLRFDYGRRIPWVRRVDDGQIAGVAGPDAIYLRSDVDTYGEDMATKSHFTIAAGERARFVLTWHASHLAPPQACDPDRALDDTVAYWEDWAAHGQQRGAYADAVTRSLITVKALTFEPTGGIVAAATTSLPEDVGGVRNWDYRFCWLRDASLSLTALLRAGYTEEAAAWRGWLLRAIAGSPDDLQIMYGLGGETRLDEYTCDWLRGYESSAPVRVGNAAAGQLQLDVYGEVVDAMRIAAQHGVGGVDIAWPLMQSVIGHLESIWEGPDEGLWEVRGPRQHFTHSKLMCWVAFDRMARAVERAGMTGPGQKWRALADTIHAQVCERAWNDKVGAFTQAYGSDKLDAAVLMMPRLGFLPGSDPRLVSTVEVIAKELAPDGLVQRYQLDDGSGTGNVDGLPGTEGSFLACSFWLADAWCRIGRTEQGTVLFERLLSLRNDVGLLAEEYDTRLGRQVGNFPQAFSHLGLVNTAFTLADH